MADKQKKCETDIKDEEASLKKLQKEFALKLDELTKLQDVEKRRVVAKETLTDYEAKLLSFKGTRYGRFEQH